MRPDKYKLPTVYIENLAPQTRIKLSTMVESSLESSKRFILQRYLAPGMYFVYRYTKREKMQGCF